MAKIVPKNIVITFFILIFGIDSLFYFAQFFRMGKNIWLCILFCFNTKVQKLYVIKMTENAHLISKFMQNRKKCKKAEMQKTMQIKGRMCMY